MNFQSFCRGVLYGGLLGDCYGFVYEDRATVLPSVPLKLLKDTVDGTASSSLVYTDDTQMGLTILRSLRSCSRFCPEDMAAQFAEGYFKDGAHRYYGGSVPKVFNLMRENRYKDPFKYAAMQFGGTGSYGNGGAMRASPAALYAISMEDHEFEKLIVDTTRLTHTHPLAIFGALLQAHSIRHLWDIVSKSKAPVKIVPDEFLDALLGRLQRVSCEYIDLKEPKWRSALSAYEQRLGTVKSLLAQPEHPTVETVVKQLGNDLRAINSVPTALYVFLRSLRPIEGIDLTSIPLRCLVYGISLGGDTDTIGTMACSLSGGLVGVPSDGPQDLDSAIPDKIMSRCEGFDTVKEMVSWLVDRPPGTCK